MTTQAETKQNSYRCTRSALYSHLPRPHRIDTKRRNGHYVRAWSKDHALSVMEERFPTDVALWAEFQTAQRALIKTLQANCRILSAKADEIREALGTTTDPDYYKVTLIEGYCFSENLSVELQHTFGKHNEVDMFNKGEDGNRAEFARSLLEHGLAFYSNCSSAAMALAMNLEHDLELGPFSCHLEVNNNRPD